MEKVLPPFTSDYREILQQIEEIDPVNYSKTRNYIDGAVTRLSPYISRGVISTKQVFQAVMKRGYEYGEIKKFIQELAWRDYWQQVWIAKGEQINEDLRQPQADVENDQMPSAIIEAQTGIKAIDDALEKFYETGYLHNHIRMYVAATACNMGKSHWKIPAQWMYYHLLDADWASNALSWQWVAGANSKKKYVANQENINKFCHTRQKGTFLDVPYEDFAEWKVPKALANTSLPDLRVELPEKTNISVDPQKPTLIYNFYNLDPIWQKDAEVNRVLLLEPSVFERYPVSGKTIKYILKLAENIPNIQVFTGEFSELEKEYGLNDFYYKEHPLHTHYRGTEESRDWIFSIKGYFPSFFAFWKRCEKELKRK